MTGTAGDDCDDCDELTPGLVSVVVPTHARPDLLEQTLVSVVAQRDVELEVIVVDDEPDPRNAAVVEASDGDVRLVHNVDGGGAASSRNVGLWAARGEWVAFCDDDDLWAPDKLASQLEAVRRHESVWSCTGAVTVGPELALVGHERLEPSERRSMRHWNLIPGGGSSVLAHTATMRATGGYDESLSNMEDWEQWIRLDDLAPVAVVDRPLVAYRLWPGSKSANCEGMRRSARQILDRHASWPPPPEVAYELEWYVMWKQTIADRRLDAARTSVGLARTFRSAKCALRSLVLVTSPAAVRAIDRRRRRSAIPPSWRREAESWLPQLRARRRGLHA